MSAAGHCGLTCTAWNAQQDQAGALFQSMAAGWPSNSNMAHLYNNNVQHNWSVQCGDLSTFARSAVEFKNLRKTSLDKRPRSYKKAVHQKYFYSVSQVRIVKILLTINILQFWIGLIQNNKCIGRSKPE